MRYSVKRAVTCAELTSAFRLRYDVFVGELKQIQFNADHARRIIRDNIDDFSTIYLLYDGDKLVGTMRIAWGGLALPDNSEKIWRISSFNIKNEEMSFTNRLALLDNHPLPYGGGF